VLKADGLAAGKGVVILDTLAEAQQEMRSMLGDAKFGAASSRVVVEEFLAGMEFSVFAVTDGKSAVILPEAKDYKRIGEGDQGPNTGGMGAVSPVPLFDEAMQKQVMSRIIEPTIEGLAKDGLPYKGFLFFGLIDVGGEAMVIEYNCRMGDPETEVVMARLDEDFLPILRDAGNGKLTNRVARQSKQSAATVMMVSEGYPGSYPKGLPISGLDQASEHAIVFQAGTTLKDEELCTAGGRVLCVTGVGNNMASALGKAYQAVASITFDGANHRKDIGQDIL
jgi:phosphoribosylamine--glycine ligase